MFQKCIFWSKSKENAAKTLKQYETDLILLQCLGGPRAASYVHSSCRSAALF